MTDTRTLAKEAAFKLLQSGQRPTADKVRSAIGRGAQQTILGALDEFWQEMGNRLSEPRLPDSLLAPVMALWSQAVGLAAEQWQGERAGFEDRIQALEQSVQTQTRERDEERAAKTQAQTRAETAETLVRQLQQRLTEQVEISRALHAETERLGGETNQLRESLQLERDARERDQGAWLQQIDAARQALKGAQAERDQLATQLDEVRGTTVRQGLLLSQAQQRVTDLESVIDLRTRERDEARTRVAAMAGEVEQRERELRQGTQLLESREAQLLERDGELRAASGSLTLLRQEREELIAENRLLREEAAAQQARRDELEKSLQLVLSHWQER